MFKSNVEEIAASESAQVIEEIAVSESAQAIENDNALIAKLSSLNPLEYDRARKEEAANLRITAPTMPDAVKNARKETTVEALPFARPLLAEVLL